MLQWVKAEGVCIKAGSLPNSAALMSSSQGTRTCVKEARASDVWHLSPSASSIVYA